MRKIVAVLLLVISIFMTAAAVAVAVGDTPEITPQPGQVNPYKTRSELLMDASTLIGAVSPRETAIIWANGLKMRSAAMQYVVMTQALKREYAAQLDEMRSNWVTGMSSPWVSSFAITGTKTHDGRHVEVGLMFETMDSISEPNYYDAKLWLVREGDYWRVERIWTDDALFGYTFYKP